MPIKYIHYEARAETFQKAIASCTAHIEHMTVTIELFLPMIAISIPYLTTMETLLTKQLYNQMSPTEQLYNQFIVNQDALLPALAGIGVVLSILAVLGTIAFILSGICLWKSARRGHSGWFIAILLLGNTLIVPLIYLLAVRDTKSTTHDTL